MERKEIMSLENKPTGTFTGGFTSVFSAFNVMSGKKGYLKYFIIPFLLNLVILSGLVYFSYTTIHPLLTGYLQGDQWYMAAIRFILNPILFTLLALVTVVLYSIIGSIVTAPFNDFLSLKVEVDLAGANFDEAFSIAVIAGDIFRVTANVFKLLGLLIAINLILFIINFIPVLGSLLFTVLSFLSTAFFLGFSFFDFPLERRRYTFGEKLKILWRYKRSTMGVGTGFFLTACIPIIGFLGLNLATVGATKEFIEHIKPNLKAKR